MQMLYAPHDQAKRNLSLFFHFILKSHLHPFTLFSSCIIPHLPFPSSTCMLLHFSISSYCLSFFISSIMSYIYYIWFQILSDPYLLSLIFVPVFISDFILHFHWYSVCLITLYIDNTIYSSILMLDSIFGLLIFLCCTTAQICTYSDLH